MTLHKINGIFSDLAEPPTTTSSSQSSLSSSISTSTSTATSTTGSTSAALPKPMLPPLPLPPSILAGPSSSHGGGLFGIGSSSSGLHGLRVKHLFTTEQKETLEKIYTGSQYIDPPTRMALAKTLGVTDKQVKIWFDNRRRKDKVSEMQGLFPSFNLP